MMNPPAWMLEWVRPLPRDEAEFNELVQAFEALVEGVRQPDAPERAKELRERSKSYERRAEGVLAIPLGTRTPEDTEYRRSCIRIAARSELMAKRLERNPRNGRPKGSRKDACFLDCYLFLAERRKRATWPRSGTVCGLAAVVWRLATGEAVSIDAWDQVGKRLKKAPKTLKKREGVLSSNHEIQGDVVADRDPRIHTEIEEQTM